MLLRSFCIHLNNESSSNITTKVVNGGRPDQLVEPVKKSGPVNRKFLLSTDTSVFSANWSAETESNCNAQRFVAHSGADGSNWDSM